jgi:hypothetical protein
MTGKIPKISDECVMAIIEKAGQESPSIFATEFLFQEEKRMVFKTELTIVVEDGVVQDVEGLPSGWTFQVDDNNVSGFEVGIYKKEQEDE